MASGIPVLNNNQMKRFREILGQNRKIDLTNKLTAKNHRLPTIPGEEPEATVSADGQIIITISNTTNATFPAGGAVAVDVAGQTMSAANVYPAKKINTSVNNPFGVCLEEIAAGATGDCLIFGLAEVTISGSSGLFAKPAASGNFTRGDEGVRIMGIASGTKAVVMLGDYYEAPVTPPSPGGGDVPPGTVIAYAGPLDYIDGTYNDQYFPDGYSGQGNIPDGWLHCHGQAVSRTTYAALFAAIGTVYGQGDGSTTFNVPDFRGSFLRGAGEPSPFAVNAHVVVEEEEGEDPTDYGYIDVTNQTFESGSFTYDEQTIQLDENAVCLPNGIFVDGVLYGYSEISDLTDVIIDGMTVTDFDSVQITDDWEAQSNMGKQLHEEFPNYKGQLMALSQDKYFPTEKYTGAFSVNRLDGRTVLTEFKMPQYSQYPSYLTIKGVDTDGNYSKTFNNCEIYWNPEQEYDPGTSGGGSGNVEENPYANKFPALLVVDFSMYMGQKITGCGNATTVNDYIKIYNTPPPDNCLTVKQNTTTGAILPMRNLIHWLIKY